MALTFGFYNSINHDRRYDAVQVGQIFDGIIKDGIYETYKKAMIVKESSHDNQVIIQPGRAWFDHTWSYNDFDYSLQMPGPESFLDRIDAVVLDINATSTIRTNSFLVVVGEASSEPQRPGLIRENYHNQYPLCYVYRHGGVNHIYQADITNSVGTSECPFVTGVIEGLSIDDLLARWTGEFEQYMHTHQAEFSAWETRQKAEFEIWAASQESSFFKWIEDTKDRYYDMLNHNTIAWNNWFSHIQSQLDDDIAGHLQNQIDQIAKFTSIYIVDKTLFVPMSAASVIDKKLVFATK